MVRVIICKSCEAHNEIDSSFCLNCGTKIDTSNFEYMVNSDKSSLDQINNLELYNTPPVIPLRAIPMQIKKPTTKMLKFVMIINWLYFIALTFIVSLILFAIWLFSVSLLDISDGLFRIMGMILFGAGLLLLNKKLKIYDRGFRTIAVIFVLSQFYWVPNVLDSISSNIKPVTYLINVVQLYALVLDKATRENFRHPTYNVLRAL